MILSRLWTIVLALIAGACFYLASVSVGQFNRSLGAAAADQTKADTQTVNWALQIDSRRRLENLYKASSSDGVRKTLAAALGKDGPTAQVKEDGRKALDEVNSHLPNEARFTAMFLIDRDGKVVSSIGFPKANNAPQMELGGYAAAFDALHGFARDDMWIWSDQIFRVVARPVEVEVHQPPAGAVIGLMLVDSDFARELAKKTRTNIVFFRGDKLIATGSADEGVDNTTLQSLGGDLGKLAEDKAFKDAGRSELRNVGSDGNLAAMYLKLGGEAADAQVGVGVVRARASIAGIGGILKNATDSDKKGVSYPMVLGIILGGALLGLLFSFLEHTLPLKAFGHEVGRLRKGEFDAFQLAKLRGVFRTLAQHINAGIERIAEKGGSVIRKPANLESILGPAPVQPQMSAFSFPNGDVGSSAALPSSAPSTSALGGAPSGASLPGAPSAPRLPGAMKPPTPKFAPPAPQAPLASFSATESGQYEEDPGESTMVGKAPEGLIAATKKSVPPSGDDELSEWKTVFEDFLRTKKQCNEPVEGFTFEKFKGTLVKNRDQLVARHQCKRVKFTVYVKDGKASLKATPVKE
jgi:hypothetical protein